MASRIEMHQINGSWRSVLAPDDGRPVPHAIMMDDGDVAHAIPVATLLPQEQRRATPVLIEPRQGERPAVVKPTNRSIDPKAFTDYRTAKKQASEIAAELGMTLIQSPDGKPRVILASGNPRDFSTWLAALSWLWQLRADRVKK